MHDPHHNKDYDRGFVSALTRWPRPWRASDQYLAGYDAGLDARDDGFQMNYDRSPAYRRYWRNVIICAFILITIWGVYFIAVRAGAIPGTIPAPPPAAGFMTTYGTGG